jgi:hypothetical protein
MLKFACVPAQYAPKRKFVNFSLPKWRQKLAEFDSNPDVRSWINNLYQDRVFPTRKEFNEAYDNNMDSLHWNHAPMVLTPEDVVNFEIELKEGAFGDSGTPEFTKAEKLVKRMRDVQSAEKIVFVY